MFKFSTEKGGVQYKCPTKLEEVTLQKFIDYCNLERDFMPNELKQVAKLYEDLNGVSNQQDEILIEEEINVLLEKINSMQYAETLLSWYARVVDFWTGLPFNMIMARDGGDGMNVDQLKALYLQTQKLIIPPDRPIYTKDNPYSNILEHDGAIWYLPDRYMMDSKTIDYLESADFYKHAEELAGGQWGVFGKVMCILVRKKDEKYSKDLYKRESAFLQWPMDKCYEVAFFLMKRMHKLNVASQTYTTAQATAKLKQALKT